MKVKERYVKTYGLGFYIKEVRPWWSRIWRTEKVGGMLPQLYIRKNGRFEKLIEKQEEA